MDRRSPEPHRAILVFLGPTMARAEARKRLDAIYLPPASQGAVVRGVLDHDPKAILLIDGTFQGEPAVRHKEILWALSRGIAVYGAASMGALRAAELEAFGMVGIGLIYRWYRRYPLAPDDAVAVLHGPPELGSPPVTAALVDLLLTFRAAARSGRICGPLRHRLERNARRLSFRDRSLGTVIGITLGEIRAGSERIPPDLEALLTDCLVHQKRSDAEAGLDRVAADMRSRTHGFPAGAATSFMLTSAFARDLEDAGIVLPPSP